MTVLRFRASAARLFWGGIAGALIGAWPCPAAARFVQSDIRRHMPGPQRVLVLDGSSVHNVGELQMHFINWGEWGARPGTAEPFSFAPSAQWPRGSGVEYLFSAGLWVGAVRNGIPAVSTATFEHEFRPGADARDRVYRSGESTPGGARPPSLHADDDGDGTIDEDRLDGYDNDGDGLVDEDFAAISRQMYVCSYRDDDVVASQIYPQHNPLGIIVHQESYQWDGERFDDFVGVDLRITNASDDVLEDVFIGMFIDADAGARGSGNYWDDDMVGFVHLGPSCTVEGPAQSLDIAYTFDDDGDGGLTPGYFGFVFLGATTADLGSTARGFLDPVAAQTFAHFASFQPYALGGDPTNDFERYELLSQGSIERNSTLPRDYRMLISMGPIRQLAPDVTLRIAGAFVIGRGLEGVQANAATAIVTSEGAWMDADRDPTTGVDGRERRIVGQASLWVDPCRILNVPRSGAPPGAGCDPRREERFDYKSFIPPGETVWINDDCARECDRREICDFTVADSLLFRSGVAGREARVPWLITSPPPPPGIRVDDHARGGVVLYWDNFSELVPDPLTLVDDFEGYRVWRADNWTRPLGTSVATGPPNELWSALLQADLINGFGQDTGLNTLRYQPLMNNLGPITRRNYIDAVKAQLQASPGEEPVCPGAVTVEICDTLQAIARRELGLTGGRQYYFYKDADVQLGRPYFYAVVALDRGVGDNGEPIEGVAGNPASNFIFVEPKSATQMAHAFRPEDVIVVPNPVTKESLSAWALDPTNSDPSGVKLEFRNLPAESGTIRIYTLAGDLVQELPFDARGGNGTVEWDLVTRNGQSIASGIYLYAIEFSDHFDRIVGKFVVVM